MVANGDMVFKVVRNSAKTEDMTGNKNSILFLLEGHATPSSRLRVLNFMPHLDREHYTWEVQPVPNSIFSRPRLFYGAAKADLVFIQKKLFRSWEIPFLARRPIVYDFDDAVMLPGRDKHGDKIGYDKNRRSRFEKTVDRADVIIAGSNYLKSLTGKWQKKTRIIPTNVDSLAQPIKKTRDTKENLILGWIGTRGNLWHLETLAGVFKNLSYRFPGLILKNLSDGIVEFDGITNVNQQWRLKTETIDLLSFDVGLMPLADTPWTWGKCGYKLLQYMSVGLPVVASPVGANLEIVRDGENGFLPRSEAEWEDCLVRLLASAALRRRMGAAGRRLIEQKYDIRLWIADFQGALEAALQERSEVK